MKQNVYKRSEEKLLSLCTLKTPSENALELLYTLKKNRTSSRKNKKIIWVIGAHGRWEFPHQNHALF